MRKEKTKFMAAALALTVSAGALMGCGKASPGSSIASVSTDNLSFPLQEKVTITGSISYQYGTE